jgi:tetratricopeptide (TPR) repeat protein
MPPRPAITEPYPGPRPFDKRERRIFFGRDEETTDVRDLIMSYQVVVLYSQSGAGKSSLVRAGIRPALIQARVRVFTARVGGDSCSTPADTQANIYVQNTLGSLSKSQVDVTPTSAHSLAEKFKQSAKRQRRPTVVIFDQFEELFTSHPERWRDRAGFFVQLREALNQNSELRALFVIREEHLAELDSYSDLVPTSFRIRYRLERLKEEAAKAAIENPAKSFGYEVSTAEVERLITNLRQIKVRAGADIAEAEGEYVEPVHLQVVCHDVWKKRNEELRSLSFPEKVEDIDQSLATYYEHAIQRAKGVTREARLRSWFEDELITPRGTRGFVYKGDRFTEGLPNKVIELLEQEHLVRSEPRGADSWYELTHDRLIAPIKRSNALWLRKRRLLLWPLYGLASVLILVGLIAGAEWYMVYYSYPRIAAGEKRQGDEQLSQKNWTNAVSNYKQAIVHYGKGRNTGKHPELFSSLGSAYMHTDNYDEAEQQFAKAISEAKDSDAKDEDPVDHFKRGQALFKSGRTSDSIKEYKTTLSITDDQKYDEIHLDTLKHLAEAELRRGEFADAESRYEEVMNHVRSFEQMGDMFSGLFGSGLVSSQKGDYDEGLSIYNLLLRLTLLLPGGQMPPRLLREIGYDQLHKGSFSEALKNIDQAYHIAVKNKDVEQEAYACLTLAEYYLEHSEHSESDKSEATSLSSGAQPQARAIDKLCPAESDLACSLHFAEQANRDFHLLNDSIMEGATLTYIARVNIGRASAHKNEDKAVESTREFRTAAELLDKAVKSQRDSERRIGEAYALQAYGLLFESEGDKKQAIGKYQESYCLYTSIQVEGTHAHMKDVAKSIRGLGGEPNPCPPQTTD